MGQNRFGKIIAEHFNPLRFQNVYQFMLALRQSSLCLFLAFAFGFCANAAQTNLLVWHKAADRVDADIRDEALWPLLETIAVDAGWRVYVEPGTTRTVSTKFKELSSGDALKMLLGNLNFALVPQTNAPARLYVFTTKMQNATRLVASGKSARHVPNELLIRVKPGTDIEALAKLLGAKIVGRIDKLGIYRLQFPDAAATDAALAQLQSDSDVLDVDYNYYFDPPPVAQEIPSASGQLAPLALSLNPPASDCSKVIIGLPDTAVQSLGKLDQFISQRISVADGSPDPSTLLHGTGMAQTILDAIAKVQPGGTSVQIVSADVYGSSETATTWNVALGIQAVINKGATFVNLSLGGSGQSPVLQSLIQSAEQDGIGFFAAAGNEPVTTPTYPAAYPGVNAVTALQNGQLAPYADYGSFVDMALPGASVVYLGNQAYMVQGTSVSTAYATGIAAGNEAVNCAGLPQIQAAMQKQFAVPSK